MGRPSALTPEAQAKITTAVAAGVPLKFAAQLAGIPESTVKTWMYLGRQSVLGESLTAAAKALGITRAQSERYSTFYTAVEEARARFIARNVAHIQQAGAEGAWQASAWLLERTHPEHFARETRVTVATTDKLEAELRELVGDEAAERMIAAARAESQALRSRALAQAQALPTRALPARALPTQPAREELLQEDVA